MLYGIEETYVTDIMKYPLEGSYPQNEKEVALSADAKELFNVQIGDNIILNTPAGDLIILYQGFMKMTRILTILLTGPVCICAEPRLMKCEA